MQAKIRLATEQDIPRILEIRLQATENVLRNRSGLTVLGLTSELKQEKSAWVAEVEGDIIGFSWARKKEMTLWALFVVPEYQGQGIGRALHDVALNWLWQQRIWLFGRIKNVWVETQAGSRAEQFYQHLGWEKGEMRPYNDVRYWMKRADFKK